MYICLQFICLHITNCMRYRISADNKNLEHYNHFSGLSCFSVAFSTLGDELVLEDHVPGFFTIPSFACIMYFLVK